MENLAAIIFASGVGTALLILPIGKAEEALVGNITKITPQETLITVLLGLLVFYIIGRIYKKMMLMNYAGEISERSEEKGFLY